MQILAPIGNNKKKISFLKKKTIKKQILCVMSPVTCLALLTFQAILVKTVFKLKPLKARTKKIFRSEAARGLVIQIFVLNSFKKTYNDRSVLL